MFEVLQCLQAFAAPAPNPRKLFRRRAEEKPRFRRGFIDWNNASRSGLAKNQRHSTLVIS
jgi:hypothetical protein